MFGEGSSNEWAAPFGEEPGPQLAKALGDEPLPGDPADIELLAATLLGPLELGLPPHAPAAVLDQLEQRGDAEAAGILTAFTMLAGEPIATWARQRARRLAARGVVWPDSGCLGSLAVSEALALDDGTSEILIGILRRTGMRRAQLVLLSIDQGVLSDCLLTPPMRRTDASSLIAGILAGDGAPEPQVIGAQELARRATEASRRAVEVGATLDADAARCMPMISRALTDDPWGLPRPCALPSWESDDPDLVVDSDDDHASRKLVEELRDELEQYVTTTYPPGGTVWRHADSVALSMLEWKRRDRAGALGRWTTDDLYDFVFDYLTARPLASDQQLGVLAKCVTAFLAFLDARQSLSGEPLDVLEDACQTIVQLTNDRDGHPPRHRTASARGLDHDRRAHRTSSGSRPRRSRRRP